MRINELRLTSEKRNTWFCVEERCAEPNQNIWHIVVPWSKDKQHVEAELKRLWHSAGEQP